nr:hypothetical protein [Lapidilactobacillus gannanensis]
MFKQDWELAQQVLHHTEKYNDYYQSEFSRLLLILVRAQVLQLNQQQLSSSDRQYLIDYLFSVEHWSRYELVLFMTTIDSLGRVTANILAHELVKRAGQ